MNVEQDEALEFMELRENLEFNQELDPADSALYVQTQQARGDFSFHDLYQQLGLDPNTLLLKNALNRQYLLFMGHIGCGKSTELRGLQKTLHDPQRYYVVFIDVFSDLDIHNLQYVDLLLLCAQKLCVVMQLEGLSVEEIHLERLKNWFQQQVFTRMHDRTLSTQVETEIKAGFTWPMIGGLLAKCTNAFKYNASYKEELREVVRNSFSEFAAAFNSLIDVANRKLLENQRGKNLLFIIDGTDRLSGDDTSRFFVENVNQLQQVRANFLYAARIQILFDTNALQHRYSALYRLPMIKLFNRDGTPCLNNARDTLQKMVYQRIPRQWFDTSETVDYLIDHCGGHPRDLVRLLSLAWQKSRLNLLNRAAAEKAVASIASDYRRLLTTEDYALIVRVDRGEEEQVDRERLVKMFEVLALLEYNDFWWYSHPVVRTLPGYKNAVNLLAT